MKVFIINLERSLERKERMQEQIQKLFEKNPSLKDDLEFIFFRAVDAKNGEHLEFKNHFVWWGSWVFGRELSDGEKACFASHYKLWQECVRLGETIMVLEDDVEFSAEFLAGGGIEDLLKSPYEYVRLCYLFDKKLYGLDKDYCLSFEKISGAQGYVLQTSAAIKFIHNARYLICPVDDYMDKFYKHKVLNIIKKPLLLKHNLKLESEISALGRPSQRTKFYKKISRECFRLFWDIHKMFFAFYMRKSLKIK
ncbi:glycosyltransferase family 25 protein [Campylobacter sp. VTCC 70190]|uniref:glycosyltransferase family 25 protein n=1 Tax=Campylobacter sp. VTCC 70190 TaxID=3392118 RepID=UPI00398EF352